MRNIDQSKVRSSAGLLRRKGMAREISLSERHLSELVKRRVIPCIRLGHRCVLFDPIKVRQALGRYEQAELGSGE